jgi:hypothetical protein
MGFTIGDINISDELINLNFRMFKTQFILQKILNNRSLDLSTDDIEKSEHEAIEFLKRKFPNMGIKEVNINENKK